MMLSLSSKLACYVNKKLI